MKGKKKNLRAISSWSSADENSLRETQWTFEDGERTIDFVLVWDQNSRKATSESAIEKRTTFEGYLREEKLELEEEYVEETGLHCVKIHTPVEILKCYAEILKLQAPIKKFFYTTNMIEGNTRKSRAKFKCNWRLWFPWPNVERGIFPDCTHELSYAYSKAKSYLFNVEAPGFFTPAKKARIVQFILERTIYSNDPLSGVFEFGINRLVMQGVYSAAYPLHDGDMGIPGSMRCRLYHHWASIRNWYTRQPADSIMEYFGVKTAFYFLWLGHYTCMLIPASFFGVLCLVLSILILPMYKARDEICSGKMKYLICPLCDRHCTFWHLSDYCFYAEILYIFDNYITVLFAIFISFWAAIYLEAWKRYSAEITVRWDLTSQDQSEENPRPEYAAKLSILAADRKVRNKLNFITNSIEPRLDYWRDLFPGKVLSLTTTILMITLSVASVLGVTMYGMIARTTWSSQSFSEFTAACINLTCIIIFKPIYAKLSVVLTELEMHRTQPEYDDSLILKMYLLQSINHYSSIFYIAFFEGRFTGTPNHYWRIFGYRQPECTIGNCMLQLTMQLAVIMIGNRIWTSVSKFFKPILCLSVKRRFSTKRFGSNREISQWEKDYLLEEAEASQLLFQDKLDMVLQYGFVTIFVSAFPLAPLFALINNIFEIRLDAQKLLLYHRRPSPLRIKDIGVWYAILRFVSQLAVTTNAFIIAFSSSFVPLMVYKFTVNKNQTADNFLNFQLSWMDINDLDMIGKPNTTERYCRYSDYRTPPWNDMGDKYAQKRVWWIVLSARLIFFVIFQNVIMLAVKFVKWIIPDVPQKVAWQMRRRNFLISEAVINHESPQRSWWWFKWLKDKPDY